MAHMFPLSIVAVSVLASALAPGTAAAQSGSSQPSSTQNDPAIRFRMPTVTVEAQKEPEDKQRVPVSVTAVPKDTIDGAGIRIVSDAGIFAPNTFFTEWSARKLSTARFRGIGSSPNNPGITTYIDGVPQLSENSSSIELVDVNQVEFVRGPQSALFGRNTLGGLVNVTSARPSTSAWTGALSVPFGNYGSWAVRGGVSGPIASDKLSIGLSFAQVDRDGFTVNDVTGNDIDSRSAFTGKAQLLWVPNNAWEGRVIFSGERARDGDYSLNDVGALRSNPFHAARDFEGRADRDVMGTTILARRTSGPVVFSSTTGFLNWKTQDVTDLDYTPRSDSHARQHRERFSVYAGDSFRIGGDRSSEIDGWRPSCDGSRVCSSSRSPMNRTPSTPTRLASSRRLAVSQHTPRSALDDFGLGLFGQATVTFNEKLDLAAGARFDYEDKSALLENFFEPPIAPPARVEAEKSFSNVSPQASIGYRVQPEKTLYATVGRGYKAGGFNPASPAGSESYGEELSWNVEGGVKTLWAGGRVSANAAVFYIDWDDLQLNIPNPDGAGAVLHLECGRRGQQGRRARA